MFLDGRALKNTLWSGDLMFETGGSRGKPGMRSKGSVKHHS